MNEYTILHGKKPVELIASVNAAMKEGWSPQGGAAVAVISVNLTYFQAMVRLAIDPPGAPRD